MNLFSCPFILHLGNRFDLILDSSFYPHLFLYHKFGGPEEPVWLVAVIEETRDDILY